MQRTRIALGLWLTAIGFSLNAPTLAQSPDVSSACDAIDEVWDSAAMISQVRGQIIIGSNEKAHLATALGNIEPDRLKGPHAVLQDEIHIRAIERFQRQALSALSERRVSSTRLVSLLTPDLFNRLQALGSRLNCPDQPDAQNDEFAREDPSSSRSGDRPELFSDGLQSTDRASGLATGPVSTASSISRPVSVWALIWLLIGVATLLLVALLIYYRRNSASERTRETRHILSLPLSVRIKSETLDAELVDVSMNGFKLRHDGVIADTGPISIRLGGAWRNAHVRWSNAHFVGGNFTQPLSTETLALAVEKNASQ